MCRSWSGKNGFKHFIADMGPQPFPRASVHRKNNDGNYRPENVIWANPKIKARNMRPNRTLSYKGKCMILVEWAEFLGMKAGTLGARLTKGWSMEEALTRPVKPWHRRGTP